MGSMELSYPRFHGPARQFKKYVGGNLRGRLQQDGGLFPDAVC